MRALLFALLVLGPAVAGPAALAAQSQGGADRAVVFRAGIELVTVNAVVRDQKGRLVTDLSRADFEVVDGGETRPIADFRAERAPITVALLFDASGSMQVASKIDSARAAARHLLAWMHPGRDELAVFAFDSRLQQLTAFAPYQGGTELEPSMTAIAPFGMTSLHDAVAATARAVAVRPNVHRAVVVLTDGVDNNSRLSAPEVSGVASSIDVPVYVMAVVSPLDHPGASTAVNSSRPIPLGDLVDLSRWTGGDCFVSSTPADASQAARRIVDDLRHQYLIAFRPSVSPGWRPLEIRALRRGLVVRARSGYFAGESGVEPGSGRDR